MVILCAFFCESLQHWLFCQPNPNPSVSMQLATSPKKRARAAHNLFITRLDGLVVIVIAAPRRQSPQKRYDEALRPPLLGQKLLTQQPSKTLAARIAPQREPWPAKSQKRAPRT